MTTETTPATTNQPRDDSLILTIAPLFCFVIIFTVLLQLGVHQVAAAALMGLAMGVHAGKWKYRKWVMVGAMVLSAVAVVYVNIA